ncbi:hypothetical protein Q9233_007122 [Columba guinea]|nr:hypothetical protein Q9233_007122 [Columba guinea]
MLSSSSNLSSFCYVVTTVMDDAPPGTQEYIMLRQDSIQSAELKKKESPFRAKCHEIFCCPLKQVHLKENTEPEDTFFSTQMFPDLCKVQSDFNLVVSGDFLVNADLRFWMTVHMESSSWWSQVCTQQMHQERH